MEQKKAIRTLFKILLLCSTEEEKHDRASAELLKSNKFKTF